MTSGRPSERKRIWGGLEIIGLVIGAFQVIYSCRANQMFRFFTISVVISYKRESRVKIALILSRIFEATKLEILKTAIFFKIKFWRNNPNFSPPIGLHNCPNIAGPTKREERYSPSGFCCIFRSWKSVNKNPDRVYFDCIWAKNVSTKTLMDCSSCISSLI